MIVDKAFTLQLVYNNLDSTLSIVHKAIAHTQPISHNSLPDIEKATDTYMTTYRRIFPGIVVPKQLILE